MFIGHHAVALASKRFAPRTNLGVLMTAVVLLDLIWPVLILLGIEQLRVVPGLMDASPMDFVSYPWSHSLVMTAVWSVAFALVWFALAKRVFDAVICGFCVASHWLLDWFTHRPDLLLTVHGSAKYGLGLWNSRPATLLVELAMLLLAAILYARNFPSRDRIGRWSFVAFLGFDVFVYLGAMFNTPPPDPKAIAWGALSALLIPLWAGWFDRHRSSRDVEVSIDG